MKSLQIKMTNIRVEDALAQVDAISFRQPKEKNCVRLLTEEMFSMMKNVLQNRDAAFEICSDENSYSLHLTARVQVNAEAREAYLGMSTDGKNRAYRGILGKLTEMMETYASLGQYYALTGTEMSDFDHEYTFRWSMSHYMNVANEEEKALDWDGLEKSIIANFADDIEVGVKNDLMEMIVTKSF